MQNLMVDLCILGKKVIIVGDGKIQITVNVMRNVIIGEKIIVKIIIVKLMIYKKKYKCLLINKNKYLD